MRYFSSQEIYARLASIYRKKMAEYDQLTIMRWCAEVMTEIITDPDNFTLVEGHVLGTPVNLLVQLPLNIIRVDRVYDYDTTKLMHYQQIGTYLSLNSADYDKTVVIDYRAIPVDENDFPLIREGFEKACEAYCTHNMFLEDFIEGLIDINRWKVIETNKDWEIEAAARAWDNVNDNYVNELMKVMINQGYNRIVNGKITR